MSHPVALIPNGGDPLIAFLFGLLVVGVVAGFAARLIVPGDDPMSIPWTIGLGILGSFVGGLIGWAIFDREDAFRPAGFIASIVGAVLVLFLWNWSQSSSRSSGGGHGTPSEA
jgi:uncharacterized membrane protein YeaQ/YmgE (transglycosylase-associated protein family)